MLSDPNQANETANFSRASIAFLAVCDADFHGETEQISILTCFRAKLNSEK